MTSQSQFPIGKQEHDPRKKDPNSFWLRTTDRTLKCQQFKSARAMSGSQSLWWSPNHGPINKTMCGWCEIGVFTIWWSLFLYISFYLLWFSFQVEGTEWIEYQVSTDWSLRPTHTMKFTSLGIPLCCVMACLVESVSSALPPLSSCTAVTRTTTTTSTTTTPKDWQIRQMTNTKVHRAARSEGTTCTVLRGGGGEGSSLTSAVLKRMELGAYFALWYALNIVYNSKFHLD